MVECLTRVWIVGEGTGWVKRTGWIARWSSWSVLAPLSLETVYNTCLQWIGMAIGEIFVFFKMIIILTSSQSWKFCDWLHVNILNWVLTELMLLFSAMEARAQQRLERKKALDEKKRKAEEEKLVSCCSCCWKRGCTRKNFQRIL